MAAETKRLIELHTMKAPSLAWNLPHQSRKRESSIRHEGACEAPRARQSVVGMPQTGAPETRAIVGGGSVRLAPVRADRAQNRPQLAPHLSV